MELKVVTSPVISDEMIKSESLRSEENGKLSISSKNNKTVKFEEAS
jgi:hypothetical protein